MSQAHPAERVPRAAARRSAPSSARSSPRCRAPSSCTASPTSRPASSSRSTGCAKGGEIDKEIYVLRRLQADDGRRRLRARAALRPHRAVRPLRARERRPPGVPVPPLPDPAGLARRAAAGGPLPPVHPGRHRHRRPRRAAVPPRRRGDAGDGRGARRAAAARRCRFQVNNRKLIQGFYRGLGIADVTAAIRVIDKLDKLPADDGRRAARRATPAPRPSRPQRCLELATIRVADTSFVERVRAPRRRGRAARDRASPSSPRWSRAARAVAGDRVTRRGQPAHRARARLLHRHRRRDLHGRLRAAEVGRRGRALRRPRRRRPHDVPRRRHLLRRLPHPRPAARRRRPAPAAAPCRAPCWSRSTDEESRARQRTPSPTRCAPAASPARSPPSPQKFGKQIRYAERRGIPFVWFAAGRRHATRSRTSAPATRCAADPATWTPPDRGPATRR